jgi:addiction module HigA family antidote
MAIERNDSEARKRLADRETVLGPVAPGEILKEDFLEPMGWSQAKLAELAKVPAMRISKIIRGRRGISADTALGLAEALNTTPEFWLNLQQRFDLETARLAREASKRGSVA